ncbi:hypothetical protein [Sphingobacterium sp. UDSM-2020]|uniref:hypothetical protein n=1 Tax=Sphingobacterium sp. UDSM-2020 TaxID=2795738 RepID=UPI001938F8D7|nr:hypothetical protein [Sphingobacterium sp. UDSM-2020]QQD16191.1 hypothetical protein JAZ75_11995 [Sphingobacterium sp. UDSM-2020]
MDSLNYTEKSNWISSQIAADLPLFTILTETDFFKIRPEILSVKTNDSITTIRTKFFLKNGDVHSIYVSLAKKIHANDTIYFLPYFDDYTSRFSKKTIGSIRYFFNPTEYSIDSAEANQMLVFNKKTAKLFKTKEIEFDYYIFKNTEERLTAEGYEFHYLTKKLLNHSAHADLNNNAIIVGKHTSTYPHEVIHLYTAQYYPQVHTWFDEGLAEYLGNDGKKLQKNRDIIKKFLEDSTINTRDILKLEDNLAKQGTSLKYDLGSLIVEKIQERDPESGLYDILRNGSDDKSFYKLVESKLHIKQENLMDSLLIWIK